MICTPPKAMPCIQPALLSIHDVRSAVDRAEKSCNKSQLIDAIRSARYFLDIAEGLLLNKGVE